jgi:hypothetical protein
LLRLVIRTALVLVVALPALAAETTIAWDEADKHVGEEVTVDGTVVDVHCSPISCLLAFEPSFNRFTAVVQARSFDTLPPAELERRYKGKHVLVHGTIRQNDGKPEIEVASPEALALAGTRRREERGAESAGRVQAEAAQRLADVLARIEELTERLAAVEERMDALLAQMEQRSAALAAAESSQGPPPPPASAAPPPAYQTLRSVKRGMSRADVERLTGPPQYAQSNGGGWTTWYWDDGRSVSFDARGRVEALSGFSSR